MLDSEHEIYSLIQALEQVNKEYLETINSGDYRSGKRLRKIKTAVKHFDVSELKSLFKSYVSQKRAGRISVNTKAEDTNYYTGTPDYEHRGVIYSCITGSYESPVDPLFCARNYDFYLLTDNMNIKNSKWRLLDVAKVAEKWEGIYANRYCKMHPFDLFPDCDYSVYIDGNVQVISDVSSLYKAAQESKIGIAMHRHPQRSCAYLESKACLNMGRGNPEKIKRQMEEYNVAGFPSNYGLCECTIIVVDHHNPIAKEILNSWWDCFLASESRRDQLSWPYTLWKNGYSIEDVGNLGNNLLYNPKFRHVNLGSHNFR